MATKSITTKGIATKVIDYIRNRLQKVLITKGIDYKRYGSQKVPF